jgi:3-methyladenine DNA glycosylase AlkD
MTADEVLAALRAAATEQTARTYRRHGVGDEVLGVSYAAMGALVKRLAVDQALAVELWRSGVHEARVVATKVADPAMLPAATVERWLGDLRDYPLTDALAGLVARSSEALELGQRWIDLPGDWPSAAGWNVLSLLAQDGRLPVGTARRLLERIRKSIRQAPNRTRYAMNGALISIGGGIPELTERALAAATEIGPVEVDHGPTGCKTPDATSYISKMAAHRLRRARITGARMSAKRRG